MIGAVASVKSAGGAEMYLQSNNNKGPAARLDQHLFPGV